MVCAASALLSKYKTAARKFYLAKTSRLGLPLSFAKLRPHITWCRGPGAANVSTMS
jgi:hypothetical protein